MTEFPLTGIWFYDRYTPAEVHAHRAGRVIATASTKFQNVTIQEFEHLGRVLILDGKIQSAEVDEYIYHELLVHPAMLAHREPRRVLVCGGGEGAPLREILRHPSVESVVMVDIDAELVALCREHLPNWHAEAFHDPRVRVVHADARAFVEESEERFDVIVNDVTDPIEGGPSKLLFTREFYGAAARVLTPGGLFATQAIGVHYDANDRLHAMIHHTVRQIFPNARSYCDYILSFDYPWAFVLGSREPHVDLLDAPEVDRRARSRGLSLRFYDGETHQRVMSLPKPLRTLIEAEQTIITDNQPLVVL
ncbi:MAG TPA: polyamine aminopropyltransferase [bacterium]|nr:polyamine aminopropyltransferase [bacterium]